MANNNPSFFNGNVKVGKMLTWSKLAGAGEIKGCKGSCGEFCKGCYNPDNPFKSSCFCFKSYAQYPAVVPAHIRNTLAMRTDMKGTFKVLDESLKRKRTNYPVRIHAAGELESADELSGWIDLASKHSERVFYIYTKNFKAVDEVLTKLKEKNVSKNEKKILPDNFFINFSVWHENGIKEYLKWKDYDNVRAYIYLDGFDYKKYGMEIDYKCPAYNEKGKMDHRFTCDKCKVCLSNRHKICGCYSH